MNISCSSCAASYDIPDEKLPVKELKARCKKCDSEIVIPSLGGAKKTEKISIESFKNERVVEVTNQLKDKFTRQYKHLTTEKQTALIITASVGVFFVLVSMFDSDILTFLFKLSILVFFGFIVVGCIKGFKEDVVVFYNNRDVYMSFMIIGSMVILGLIINIIDSFLFDGGIWESDIGNTVIWIAILCSALYFIYNTILSSLFHNRGQNKINMVFAISAKLGTGIIYPAVLLLSVLSVMGASGEMNNAKSVIKLQQSKNDRDSSLMFMMLFAITGGWLIENLVNGVAVYEKRGWEVIDTPEA